MRDTLAHPVRDSLRRAGCCALLAATVLAAVPASARGRTCASAVRDLGTGLEGDVEGIVSPRFMRRMWLHDGYLLALVQQGGHLGRYLSLYRTSMDAVEPWYHVADVAGAEDGDAYLSGDGFLTDAGDLVVVVSARQWDLVADVTVHRFAYDGGGHWTRSPAQPVRVMASNEAVRHLNATITRDSAGRLFVAYVRLFWGTYAIAYSVSENGGRDWREAPMRFGKVSPYPRRNARVTTARVGSSDVIAVVYYDHDATGESLRWNFRPDDVADPEAGWLLQEGSTAELIQRGPSFPRPNSYRHWSVARDDAGGLHLTFEGPDGIHYASYDGGTDGRWAPSVYLGEGGYSNVSTSAGGGRSFVYVFSDHLGAVFGAALDPYAHEWTPWYRIGAADRAGRRRVSSPERFPAGPGSRLPVLFQHDNPPPRPLTALRMSVLLDCE